MPEQYTDLHCHPAFRPLNRGHASLWQTHIGKQMRKVIRAQLKGKRAAIFDQSGYPKLTNGQVKIVFASLYPLEQGFMTNNSILLNTLNIPLSIGKRISMLFNRMGRDIHVRDYLLSLFIRFPAKRIQRLKDQEYWDGFQEEFSRYRQEQGIIGKVEGDTLKEIKTLIRRRSKDFPKDYSAQSEGRYIIADGDWDGSMPLGNDILTIMTMEGLGIVSQTKKGAPNRRHGTKLEAEQVIFERIDQIKHKYPIFFATFSHHFATDLCGHARSVPDIARNLGLLDQEYFVHENFSELGYRVLQYLLAVKPQAATWVDDDQAGRRVLVDVKHMSLKGRLTLHQMVRLYNQGKSPEDRIPIIASHVGYSGRTVGQMLATIRRTGETTVGQIDARTVKYGRDHTYNTWSINLASEEIRWIIDSDGMIGISMEQNNLGVGFGAKTKGKQPYFTHLVMNQLLDMAKAAGAPDFWDHITLGTDFDGLIDPIDHYSSALFFYGLRQDLSAELNKLTDEELSEASLPRATIGTALNKLFFDNAKGFLSRHFDSANMPKPPMA